jgi:hypothetical protein
MEVSGQLHAPAALPTGKSPWYPLDRSLIIGGKVKLSLCLTKNDAMKTYGRVEVSPHAFLT